MGLLGEALDAVRAGVAVEDAGGAVLPIAGGAGAGPARAPIFADTNLLVAAAEGNHAGVLGETTVRAYVFLDPDGTQDFGLLIVVASPTGVIYAHQCAGLRTAIREQEGFAIPVGGPDAAMPLRTFFRQRFKGNPPSRAFGVASTWTNADVRALETLIGSIPLWRTLPDVEGDSERAFLKLDINRISDATEGWIPVHTVYGPGILLFKNSD